MSADELADARKLCVAFSLMLSLLIAAVLPWLGPKLLRDPDSWWHIKVGLDILASGTIPTVDHYSYTFAGYPWIAKEWLGQVLFALAYLAAGWNGVVLAVTASVALTAFCVCWSLGKHLRPALAAAVALAIIVLIAPVFTARPHLFTLPLIIIWTARLFEAASEETAPPFWLLGIVWLWANLHATFTLAFVIAGFAGLDLLTRIRFSNQRLLGLWIVFGVLSVIVTLFNPYGFKAILATFTVAYGNEAVALINEWQPFDAPSHRLQEFAILAGLFGLLVSGVKISWPRALFCVAMLHLYLTHIRFVYLFFLLVPLISVEAVVQRYSWLSVISQAAAPRDPVEGFLTRRFATAVPVLLLLIVCAATLAVQMRNNEPGEETSAKAALAYVSEHGISGRVLNSYNLGGTLIFHGIPTFIDGRTDQLFLGGFAKTDNDTMRPNGKALLESQIAKYGIDWALLAAEDARIGFFDEMPNWRRVFSSEDTVVFLRTSSDDHDKF